VAEKPSEASEAMCILNLRVGFIWRFIWRIRSMRCFGGVRVILCKDGRFFGGSGWIWCLYHATADGRLFNYPEHLSRGGSLENTLLGFFALGEKQPPPPKLPPCPVF
jgi:hypothetical protein